MGNSIKHNYLDIVDQFNNGNKFAFKKIWEKARGMIRFEKYFDPSGARGREDFESIAMRGLLNGLRSFNPSRGNIISWIRNQMEQEIVREIQKIGRELPTNSIEIIERGGDGDKLLFEEKFFRQITAGISYTSVEYHVEVFNHYVSLVEKRLKKFNPNVLKIFRMKIKNPNIMHKDIAEMWGVSNTMISWWNMFIEETVMKMVAAGEIGG